MGMEDKLTHIYVRKQKLHNTKKPINERIIGIVIRSLGDLFNRQEMVCSARLMLFMGTFEFY